MKVAFVIVFVIAVLLTTFQAGTGTGTLESRRGEFTTLCSTIYLSYMTTLTLYCIILLRTYKLIVAGIILGLIA